MVYIAPIHQKSVPGIFLGCIQLSLSLIPCFSDIFAGHYRCARFIRDPLGLPVKSISLMEFRCRFQFTDYIVWTGIIRSLPFNTIGQGSGPYFIRFSDVFRTYREIFHRNESSEPQSRAKSGKSELSSHSESYFSSFYWN